MCRERILSKLSLEELLFNEDPVMRTTLFYKKKQRLLSKNLPFKIISEQKESLTERKHQKLRFGPLPPLPGYPTLIEEVLFTSMKTTRAQ